MNLIFLLLFYNSATLDVNKFNRESFARLAFQYGSSVNEIKANLGLPNKIQKKPIKLNHNQITSDILTLEYNHLSVSVWRITLKSDKHNSTPRVKELLNSISFSSCLGMKAAPCFIGSTRNDIIQYFGAIDELISSKENIVYMVPYGDAGLAPISFQLNNSKVSKITIQTYID